MGDDCYDTGEVIGKTVTAQFVFETLKRDKAFYETSGGGVTVSGGEPLYQPEFTGEILRLCKEAGIHTAVETSGFAIPSAVETALANWDLVLFDIKETDPRNHLRFTGVPSMPIIENLHRINEKGIPFALSNVIEHKGKVHEELKRWVDKNHFNLIYIKANYSNSNYQVKDKSSITREVLITNY